VTRLNRRALAIAVGALVTGITGATIWSLQANLKLNREPGVELHNVDRIAHAEGLDQLPSDYSKLPAKPVDAPPVLGNPLPGDLGVPMLRAEQQLPRAPDPAPRPIGAQPDTAADAARMERANREREAENAAAVLSQRKTYGGRQVGNGPACRGRNVEYRCSSERRIIDRRGASWWTGREECIPGTSRRQHA
jgi:type IV secretion system protein VirB10